MAQETLDYNAWCPRSEPRQVGLRGGIGVSLREYIVVEWRGGGNGHTPVTESFLNDLFLRCKTTERRQLSKCEAFLRKWEITGRKMFRWRQKQGK